MVAQDIRENPALVELGVEYMDVDTLLAVSDIVSLHVPLLPSTFHIINAARWVMWRTRTGVYRPADCEEESVELKCECFLNFIRN